MRLHTLFVAFCLLASSNAAPPPDLRPGRGRVILVTFDGLGQEIWSGDPVSGELVSLRRLRERGVSAAGVRPAFPSTTANSHAAIWTGSYDNGVFANANPVIPKHEHGFLERRVGFRSESLRAEPVWAAAARQGVRTAAHQVTQGYPFSPLNTAPEAETPPVVVNGYQTRRLAPHAVLGAGDVTPEPCAAWRPDEARAGRCFSWKSGEFTFHGAIVEAAAGGGFGAMLLALDPARSHVRVTPREAETGFERGRELGRHFSSPLRVRDDAGVFFRLFSLSSDGGEFLLYQTSAQELAIHDPDSGGAATRGPMDEAGPFVPNGPVRQYLDGRFGPPLPNGGDGTAERRYLEAVELVTRQFNRYSRWFWERYSPALLIDYFPYPDEVDHTWLGLLRLPAKGVLRQAVSQLDEMRRWAYRLIDTRIATLVSLAGPDDHVIVTADHGMAAAEKLVKVNLALQGVALPDDRGNGAEGAAAPLAAHLHYCVLLNTVDWRGGLVRPDQTEEAMAAVEAALRGIRDPETGEAVVTEFYRNRATNRELPRPELCFDLRPGYAAVDGAPPMVERAKQPFGTHGYSPERPEMQAVLIAAGPLVAAGETWPVLRSIDIAPLVCDLLGIEPPRDSEGQSPLVRQAGAGHE